MRVAEKRPMSEPMLRVRYVTSCFRFWFGSIWAAVGVVLATTFGALASKEQLAEGEGSRTAWMLAAGGGLLVGAIGAALVLSALRECGRRIALLRSGTPAAGSVVALEVVENVRINQRNPVFLRVAYKDELGRAHEGASAWLPVALRQRWQPGDPVRVVYDPFDPAKCEIDIFGAHGA
jgi:hypothetical protein